MYAATLTTAGHTNTMVGPLDHITEWLTTQHDLFDIDTVLSAMLTVITYGKTRGDITTTTGTFAVRTTEETPA